MHRSNFILHRCTNPAPVTGVRREGHVNLAPGQDRFFGKYQLGESKEIHSVRFHFTQKIFRNAYIYCNGGATEQVIFFFRTSFQDEF